MEGEKAQLNSDVDELVDMYINWEGTVPMFLASLFAQSALRIEGRDMPSQTAGFPPGQCEIGTHRLFITSDGSKYMCERVGKYGKLGNLSDIAKCTQAYEAVTQEISDFFERNCKKCYLVRFCDMCCRSMRLGSSLGDVRFVAHFQKRITSR